MFRLLGILCVYCNRTIFVLVWKVEVVWGNESFIVAGTPFQRELEDIGFAKARKVRQASYYSDLEKEIEDSKEMSRAGNTEPAGSFGGETGQSICVVAKCID